MAHKERPLEIFFTPAARAEYVAIWHWNAREYGERRADGYLAFLDSAQLINELDRSYPGIKSRICDEAGNLRRFVNVFLNEEDIRFLEKEKTSLKDGDEVSIVPAIAGG